MRTAAEPSSRVADPRSRMAQGFPPPASVPYVRPAGRRYEPANVAGLGLIFAGFIVFMFGTLVAAVTGFVHPVVMAGLGFALMVAGGGVMAAGDSGKRTSVPPPPAVQSPPSGGPQHLPGSIEIPCPNCGAPPQSIDRFGVATCGYCQTRFLVR